MPEYEHPGVYVEERGSPKPIDGVPTGTGDALSAADRAQWLYGIAIGGAILAGLGVWMVMVRGNVVIELIRTPAGVAGLGAILGSALVLSMLRALVEWRRRRAGRPSLKYGALAIGLFVFQLATLVAVVLCVLAWAASLLVAPNFSSGLLAALINVLVGCVLIRFAGGSLRDLLLLAQAARRDA